MNKFDPAEHDGPRLGYGPLRGKTILVTRARAQSEDITSQLEAFGARVIHCPTIEVGPPSNWAQLDASIEKIHEYDWIVFTSANGAHFFFRRLSETRNDGVQAIARQIVCAIGPATARAVAAATEVGLVVTDLREESLEVRFCDVGAVVYFLRKVIWTVPGFTVAAYRERLKAMHELIESDGAFVSHAQRFLIEAVKDRP